MAEDGWNSRDPEKVALAYTIDSRWRNRAEFPNGRQEIVQFLKRKWAKELDFNYDAASDTFAPGGKGDNCGHACHTAVKAKDYIFHPYQKR